MVSIGRASCLWPAFKIHIFLVCRSLFEFFQTLWWRISGTWTLLCQAQLPDNYEKSAQVLDIWFRHTWEALGVNPDAFITTHHSFTSPDYVLKDNVTLAYITKTQAIFVEVDPSIDVYDSKLSDFCQVTQFVYAKRVIVMPISSFHRLAEEIGDPQAEVIFVAHTSRCGTTLLCKMFEHIVICVSMCEPTSLKDICNMRKQLSEEAFEKLMRDATRLLCKPSSRKYAAYVIKSFGSTIEVIPPLSKMMPQVKLIFMYRNGLKNVQSLFVAYSLVSYITFLFLKARFRPTLLTKDFRGVSLSISQQEAMGSLLKTTECCSCFLWASRIALYLNIYQNSHQVAAVKYEDILKDPAKAVNVIFKFCGLPCSLCSKALVVMNKDSQSSLPFSRKHAKNVPRILYEGKLKAEMDRICDIFDVPRLSEDIRLPGTITGR